MDRRRWLIRGMLGGLVWIWLGPGFAQAGTIPPTNPGTRMLNPAAPVSVSLYQLDSTLPTTVTSSSPSRCTRVGAPGAPSYYRDVTDCWLPEVGKSVFVVVNGSTATPTLVPPAATPAPTAPNPWVEALTTSAYPGQYINDVGSETTADAVLSPAATSLPTSASTSVTGWELTPLDGGAMTVIQIETDKVIVPQDGTASVAANGLPEIWEALYGGNLNPASDADIGPAANSSLGDGISTFDEYRGAIVGGKHVRLDPVLKDLVVGIVTGQCPTSTSSTSLLLADGYPKPTSPDATLSITLPRLPGDPATFTASAAVFSAANVRGEIIQLVAGTIAGRARILAFTSATSVVAEITQAFTLTSSPAGSWKLSESLLATVYTLFSPERVRVLGSEKEWVSTFVSYSDQTGRITYDTAAGAGSDRVINVNRLYGSAQKGIRVIECLDDSTFSPYGYALGGVGSPNEIGNITLYTKRIATHLSAVINSAAPKKVQYSPMHTPKYRSGKLNDWDPKTLVPDADLSTTSGDGFPGDQDVKDFIISKAIQFYVAHEVGHSLGLNIAAPATPHFPAFNGDILDTAITSKVAGGFNTFYIPSGYSSLDQSVLGVR